MKRDSGPVREDVGAAMLAWYARAAREFPAGLVTQAQAAYILAISRMAVSRLVARGHLRAVYFPRPPDIVGVPVGRDDPGWQEVADSLGIDPAADVTGLPKACYVSFADVAALWKVSRARQRCRRNWADVLAAVGLTEPAQAPPEPETEAWML